MRPALWLSLLIGAESARVRSHTSHELATFHMMESISMASGYMNMTTGVDHAEQGKICDSLWPGAELDSKFRNSRFVGSGATACVFLAEDKRGETIAIKVGKHASVQKMASQLKEWTDECNDMNELRIKACEGGSDILKLHEHYMPSCFLVGTYSKGAYYAMHAAGPTPIRDVPKLNHDETTRKSIFAQFVQAVYGLHAIKMSHNDLHGQNIVLEKHDLSIIDLGSLKTTVRSWKRGYKRDSNAVWRWGAVLAECDDDAQWPQNKPGKDTVQKMADAFEVCIKSKWSPDAEFMSALHNLLVGDVNESKDHKIVELYKTNWISSRTPPLRSKFVSDITAETQCLSWDKKKWQTYWFKKSYPNHVKCETIPAYHWQTSKTKKGQTKVTDHYQCAIPGRTFDSACYRMGLRGSEIWACGGCGLANEQNSRACFFKTHEHYDKVGDFK